LVWRHSRLLGPRIAAGLSLDPLPVGRNPSFWFAVHRTGVRLRSAGGLFGSSEFTPTVRRLGCLRGISTLTGFALVVEIGDWTQFLSFIRQEKTVCMVAAVRRRTLGVTPRMQVGIAPLCRSSQRCGTLLGGVMSSLQDDCTINASPRGQSNSVMPSRPDWLFDVPVLVHRH